MSLFDAGMMPEMPEEVIGRRTWAHGRSAVLDAEPPSATFVVIPTVIPMLSHPTLSQQRYQQ